MKRNTILLAVLAIVGLAAWTQNSAETWLRGVLYAGSSKVALSNSTGNLSTTTGTFSGAVAVSGALGVTGAVTLSNATVKLSSVSAGVTADAGSAQGNGAMTTLAVQATTVGTGGDAVTLPTPAVGAVVFVCNAAAANAMDAFPPSGVQINKETANTAISLAAGECMFCIGFSTTRWGCTIGSAT
jgi:hypothetical protein